MTKNQIRRWAARAAILFLALYFSVSAFAGHQDYFRLLGGIGWAYIFVWLGGEIERNREQLDRLEGGE